MTDMTVSRTILAQLGGSRFLAMTGATNLVGSDDALTFKVGRGAKNKITHVRVTLDASDTYTLRAMKYNARSLEMKDIQNVSGVYADNLPEVFTSVTGFYTKL